MRLTPAPGERRPDPPPLDTDDRLAVLVGTAVWVLLLIGFAVNHDRLEAAGRGWWVWTPITGIALGLYGLRVVRRRREANGRGEDQLSDPPG